jgi:Spy/CpxP family protein refolding chaperone
MRRNAVLVLVLLLSATTLLAQAPPPPGDGPHRPAGPFGRCLSILGLSTAQQEGIKAALEAAGPTLQALHETLRTDREALKAALDAATPDACAIGTAVLKVESDQKAIRAEMDKLKASIEAILTPDQKLKFAGCMEGQAAPDGPGGPPQGPKR